MMNNLELIKNKIRELVPNSEEIILDELELYKIKDFVGEKGKNLFKDKVPMEPGVYFVLNLKDDDVEFKIETDAKFAKGKEYKNLDNIYKEYNKGDKTILYIGKADGKNGINQRLKQYFRQYKSHSGGRLIWQIEDNINLGVVWIKLKNIKGYKNAEEFEKKLLENYNKKYNINNENKKIVRPIANWRF